MASASPGVSDRAGRFVPETVGDEAYFVFHPKPLPPEPQLLVAQGTQRRLELASQELGRLDGVTLLLPDVDLFLYHYVRKEAVLSAQIEGTQSSLSELLLYEPEEAVGVPDPEIAEPLNYVLAMNYGLDRVRDDFPISNRLFREIHERLVASARGGDQQPGEFRRSQNWIGGTRPGDARFVPPPHTEIPDAMGDLERFIHDQADGMPLLLRAALSHAQFETIHPFLDGNGRLGRLLITLLLCAAPESPLSQPVLFLSLYLKERRDDYYDHLQRIRTHGEWEPWVDFFLDGVASVARAATDATTRIVRLLERDRAKTMRHAPPSALRLYELAVRQATFRIPDAARKLQLTDVTVSSAANRLVELGIINEITGRQRNKRFVYTDYLAILAEGTEQ